MELIEFDDSCGDTCYYYRVNLSEGQDRESVMDWVIRSGVACSAIADSFFFYTEQDALACMLACS